MVTVKKEWCHASNRYWYAIYNDTTEDFVKIYCYKWLAIRYAKKLAKKLAKYKPSEDNKVMLTIP